MHILFTLSELALINFLSNIFFIDLTDGVFLELLYRLLFPRGAHNKAQFMKTFEVSMDI